MAQAQQVPPPPAGCSGCLYIVQPGDSLFSIAQRFVNVTVAALIAANPQITDPSLIFPGQVICIPSNVPAPPPVPPFIQHLQQAVGTRIRVVTQCGTLTGILQNVFPEHILLLADGVPHHVRIDPMCWFNPAPLPPPSGSTLTPTRSGGSVAWSRSRSQIR